MFAQADRAAHEPPFGGVKVRARVQCASGVPEWSDPCKVILPEVWLYRLMEEFRMPRKRHKAEEIVTKLRQVEVLAAQRRTVAEAIRSIGVTEVTYYR